ncbi:MAG: SURF1 family protein [Alphaproteobacteria bacterium]
MPSFPIAGGVFTPRFWPSLITCIVFITLMGLGTWQVHRLQWKENLVAEIEARLHQDPVDVTAIIDPVHSEYTPIRASGTLRNDHELYINGISLDGVGGYHVLVPLEMKSGRHLMVDRGWVPYEKRDPATRKEGLVEGPLRITGLLRLPHTSWMRPPNDPLKNQWYSLDLPSMAKAMGVTGFFPFVLEASAEATPQGGYPIAGQTRIKIVNNHFAYAVTWYGLALAILVIYGVSGWRKVS